MNITIKIAGIGGQGVQFLGKLISQSAFNANFNVSQGVIYEPSTSGGLTATDITITKTTKEIVYPFIDENPNFFLILAQRGLEEYKDCIGPDTIVLGDETNINDFTINTPCKLKILVPFAKTALELKSEKAMNLVALGYLSELLDFEGNYFAEEIESSDPDEAEESTLLEVAPEHFENSLIHSSPAKFQEINSKAFKKGYELAKSQKLF